jgi:mRNA interferase MazF
MKRGDVVLFDYPYSDRTGSKLRSALIVQADLFNQVLADTILVPITRTRRGTTTEVVIEPTDGGVRYRSVADCKNLFTADKKFVHATIGALTASSMQKIDDDLRAALGI